MVISLYLVQFAFLSFAAVNVLRNKTKNIIFLCVCIYLKTRAVHTVELASGDFAVRRVYLSSCILLWGTSGEVLVVKNSPANAGDIRDIGSVPGLGGSPGGGHGNPLQYSCMENSMDRGALQAAVQGVAKSWT